MAGLTSDRNYKHLEVLTYEFLRLTKFSETGPSLLVGPNDVQLNVNSHIFGGHWIHFKRSIDMLIVNFSYGNQSSFSVYVFKYLKYTSACHNNYISLVFLCFRYCNTRIMKFDKNGYLIKQFGTASYKRGGRLKSFVNCAKNQGTL